MSCWKAATTMTTPEEEYAELIGDFEEKFAEVVATSSARFRSANPTVQEQLMTFTDFLLAASGLDAPTFFRTLNVWIYLMSHLSHTPGYMHTPVSAWMDMIMTAAADRAKFATDLDLPPVE